VNMKSLLDNHNKRLFECFYNSSPSISDSNLPSPSPKQSEVNLRVLNF